MSNTRKTPEGIHDTIRRLSVLRDAWNEIQRRQEQTQNQERPYEAFAAAS